MTKGPTPIDRTGQRIGRLILVQFSHRKAGSRYWVAECNCSNRIIFRIGSYTKSCGCLVTDWAKSGKARRTHGRRASREYNSWAGMKARCLNPNSPKYKRYGARGITISKEWMQFINFYRDMGNKPSPTHSIDRIDNDGNYCQENCRWSTQKQQARNRRSTRIIEYRGEIKSLAYFSEKYGINCATIASRLTLGWGIDRALETPVRTKRIYFS